MTDNEIIKAVEHCRTIDCTVCELKTCHKTATVCRNELIANALALINRQKAEIARLEYIVLGIMHSVDKWLDGDELEQDEVNRAVTMREKTLQIVERQKAEIEKSERIIVMADKCIEKQKTEIETLTEKLNATIAGRETLQKALTEKSAENERLKAYCDQEKCAYAFDGEVTDYCVQGPCSNFKTAKQIRAEAIKEFAERLKERSQYSVNAVGYATKVFYVEELDNLVKEMVEGLT